ncbi:MAG: hypothetical protein WCP24_02150 [bacterium]
MISKWFRLKDKAIALRKDGKSIRDIEGKLGIPRSTLSGWLKDIKLSKNQKKILDKNWRIALGLSREKAVAWHNKEKAKRLGFAKLEATNLLKCINVSDKKILELALSMLYLGEGAKTEKTSLGNSDSEILLFFAACMEKLYGLSRKNVRCDLHLRADQNIEEIKIYWSKKLRIPLANFKSASIDKRTIGRKTYPYYKGVCILNYANVAIQRKLVYLSREYCTKISK